MASQPANTTLSVEFSVRAKRELLLDRMVLNVSRLVMVSPGEESGLLESRDNTVLTTTALDVDKDGLPIVRYARPVVTPAAVKAAVSNLAMPKRIGKDLFFVKKSGYLTDDLMGQVKAV